MEGLGPAENALMFADSLAVFTDHGSTLQILKVSDGICKKKKKKEPFYGISKIMVGA